MLATFHSTWAYVAVVLCAAAGLWGIGLRLVGRAPGRPFWWAVGLAVGALVLQVGAGLIMLGQGRDPGSIHVFYGIVILFTLAFAYIYRGALARRPALAWGLLMLFLMGLGIRGIASFGQSFGG